MSFPGISVFERKIFFDNRGFFSEIFSDKLSIKTQFIQDNFSVSAKGVFRGLHFQENVPQAKFITVLRGKILDFALDIRQNSPTFGEIFVHEISEENPKNIFIPRGFAHGFLTLSDDSAVFYKVDNVYSPNDERGFCLPKNFFIEHFSEILAQNNISEMIFSEKDKKLPPFPGILKIGKLF